MADRAFLQLAGERVALDRETLEAMAALGAIAEPIRAYLALDAADDFTARRGAPWPNCGGVYTYRRRVE